MKESDWLKESAERLLQQYQGSLWTSRTAITELFLLADRYGLDPEVIVAAAAELVEIRGTDVRELLLAAWFLKEKQANVFDALHAAAAFNDSIISSDRVYDRLGLRRIRLE